MTQRLILCALVIAFAAGFFSWIRRPGDLAGYVAVGELVLQGKHIYGDAPSRVNTWPPLFSLLCVPLAVLSAPTPYLARGVWIMLNMGLLLFVLHMLSRMIHGRPLGLGRGSSEKGLSLADPKLLVPLVLTYRFVISNFEHLQVNILIFSLALLGLFLCFRKRDALGSAALGCAAALKVMPVVFILYFTIKRQWRRACYTTVAFAAFSLSPILVFGWPRFWGYMASWHEALSAGWGVGRMNQSVFAMWDRLIGHGMMPLTARGIDWVPASGDPRVTAALGATFAIAGVLTLWSFLSKKREDPETVLTEWAILFILSSILGPVAWKAYLVVLLLPNALLFSLWRSPGLDQRTRRGAGLILVVSFVLSGLTSPGLVGRTLSGMLEMSSVITLSALLMLGGLLWLRFRLPGALAAGTSGGE